MLKTFHISGPFSKILFFLSYYHLYFARIYLGVSKTILTFVFVLQEGCYKMVSCKMPHGHSSWNSLTGEIQQSPSLTPQIMRAHISSHVLKSLLSHSIPTTFIEKIIRQQVRSEVIADWFGEFIDWIIMLIAGVMHQNHLKCIVLILLILCKKKKFCSLTNCQMKKK